MSNSNSFVDHVVVVDIELVAVQWRRIEDIYHVEVDVEKYICRLLGIQHPSCSRCKLLCLLILHFFLFLLLSSPSTGPFRESCPLRDLLCDEFVLSFSSPHHRAQPPQKRHVLTPNKSLCRFSKLASSCCSYNITCKLFLRPPPAAPARVFHKNLLIESRFT